MLELGHPTPHRQILHHDLLMNVNYQATDVNQLVEEWQIPIVKTMALSGEGVDEAVFQINQHYQYLQSSGRLAIRNRTRLTTELQSILQAELMERLLKQLPPDILSQFVEQVVQRDVSPFQVVQQILANYQGDN
jgi:LAO/AO transport system kinase